MMMSTVEPPRVVSQAEWLAARKELLAKEKNLTRQRDALSAERRSKRRINKAAQKFDDQRGAQEDLVTVRQKR